jgi:hypothetical protein
VGILSLLAGFQSGDEQLLPHGEAPGILEAVDRGQLLHGDTV